MEAQDFGDLETLDELLGSDTPALTWDLNLEPTSFSKTVIHVAARATQDFSPL